MKKKLLIILCIAGLFSLTSCRIASPETPAQELASHRWEPLRLSGELSFDDSVMNLSVNDGESKIDLSGEYYADDNKLTVMTPDSTTFVFNYTLEGEKLLLTYAGRTMELKKADIKEDPTAFAAGSKN